MLAVCNGPFLRLSPPSARTSWAAFPSSPSPGEPRTARPLRVGPTGACLPEPDSRIKDQGRAACWSAAPGSPVRLLNGEFTLSIPARAGGDPEALTMGVPPEGPPGPPGGPISLDEAGVVELGLLLPRGQAAALEAAAHRRGLTAGQLLRCLLRDFLATSERSRGLSGKHLVRGRTGPATAG